MPWQNPESRSMPVHPELLMKLLNPIWKELLQRLARLHAIIMITSIMETINVDMVIVTINFQYNEERCDGLFRVQNAKKCFDLDAK